MAYNDIAVDTFEPLHGLNCTGGRVADIEYMESQLNRYPILINKIINGESAIVSACKQLHIPCVIYLLRKGATVYTSRGKKSLIHSTCVYNNNYWQSEESTKKCVAIVKLILSLKHADDPLYHCITEGFVDFFELISIGATDVVRHMLEYDIVFADLRSMEPNVMVRTCPLINALEAGNFDILKLLLLHGATFRNFVRRGIELQTVACFIVGNWSYGEFEDDGNDVIQVLQLFRNFGGSLLDTSEFHRLSNVSVFTLLRNEGYNDEEVHRAEIIAKNPLSLQATCRLKLWRKFGKNYWKNVENLNLPDLVVKYLKLELKNDLGELL